MEEPKHPFSNEPGRRYAAGRVQPRSSDGFRVVTRTQSVSNSPIPDRHSTPHHKVVDGIAKPAPSRTVSKAKPALPRPHRSLVLKRHIVERADQHKKQVKRDHKRHFASFVVALIVICALAVISWVFWDFLPVVKSVSLPFISHNQQQSNPPELNMSKVQSNLDQTKPNEGEVQMYQAAADAPRILRIPKLNIEARVKRVGSSLTGEPISPNNIFDVGWFDESSKPGQSGAVLINGHIEGTTKNGVFHDLNTLQPNDEILLERGDKTVLTYIVNKVQVYSGDQIDMGTALQSITADKNGLNLMTSTANYDGGAGQSGQRVIVFAVQK